MVASFNSFHLFIVADNGLREIRFLWLDENEVDAGACLNAFAEIRATFFLSSAVLGEMRLMARSLICILFHQENFLTKKMIYRVSLKR